MKNRLGLSWEQETRRILEQSWSYLSLVSPARRFKEWQLICREESPADILVEILNLGGWEFFFAGLPYKPEIVQNLASNLALETTIGTTNLAHEIAVDESMIFHKWFFYLLLLLELSPGSTVELAEYWGLPPKVQEQLLLALSLAAKAKGGQDLLDRVFIRQLQQLTLEALYFVFQSSREKSQLSWKMCIRDRLYTVLKAGFPAERLYFHGNNKSPEELELAVKSRVGRFVVDNIWELENLNKIAGQSGVKAQILLRVQPGIDAHTHEYIRTGQIDSKFGMAIATGQAMEIVKLALTCENIDVKGIHCHIGSQIFEIDSFRHAAEVMMSFMNDVRVETGTILSELNLGGGFGIYYSKGDAPAPIGQFADTIMKTVSEQATRFNLPRPKIIVEPGRSIVGTAGTTLYTVGSIKNIPGVRTYVAVDGGMSDNPRPALYQAKYEAMLANKGNSPAEELVSITGKCCESGDMLIWDIKLPKVESGDILAAVSYTHLDVYKRQGHRMAEIEDPARTGLEFIGFHDTALEGHTPGNNIRELTGDAPCFK